MVRGKIFYWSCLAFIAGIAVASFLNVPVAFVLFGLLILAALFILSFRFSQRAAFLGILLLFFLFAVFRYQSVFVKISESELARLNLSGQAVSFTGLVDEEPKLTDKSQQLVVQTEAGRVLIVTHKYPSYSYGDKVQVKGVLKAPENFADFDYRGWLAKDGIYSTALFPEVQVLGSGRGHPLKTALYVFKEKFQAAWRKFLSPPQLGIFEALVFGEENNIPDAWKEKLNFSGTRHLTAVSGMNITIISFLVLQTMLAAGFWRKNAAWFTLILIWLYILMIGLPASALRAGVMVSLVFAAQFSGRNLLGERLLALAAFLLLWENPLLLRYDPGFQLSFLAMAGLIFWQPFFLEKIFAAWPNFLRQNLSTVFAAQVFVFPIVGRNFGYFSLVSPLSNILIAPLVPYLTIAGFVFGSIGAIFAGLGRLFSFLIWPALNYLLWVVDLSLSLPLAKLELQNFPLILLVGFYLLLVFLTQRVRKTPLRF